MTCTIDEREQRKLKRIFPRKAKLLQKLNMNWKGKRISEEILTQNEPSCHHGLISWNLAHERLLQYFSSNGCFLHFTDESLPKAAFQLQNESCHHASFRQIMRVRAFFSTSAQTDVSFILPTNRYLRMHFSCKMSYVILPHFVKSCAWEPSSVLQLKRMFPPFYPQITT